MLYRALGLSPFLSLICITLFQYNTTTEPDHLLFLDEVDREQSGATGPLHLGGPLINLLEGDDGLPG